jgi:hypothetical protein
MRQQISKRVDALERAADREFFIPYAIAYYLGGAKHESEALVAYARALGYQDLEEFCQACADLLLQPSDREDRRWGIRARAQRAQGKLLAKFGYKDLHLASPAALADAADRMISALPEEWRALMRSAHRTWCENEAKANKILELAEEISARSPNQTAPGRQR